MLLNKHTGVFRFKDKDIPFHYWSKTDGQAPPDTVLFLGAGQVDKIPYWIARAADPGVVVIGGVPHWETGPNADGIEEFVLQYFSNAFRVALATFGQRSMHLIAESQAAPAAIALVNGTPTSVRNLVLIRPLGFTAASFGNTVEERLRSFRKRIRQNYLQFPHTFWSDPRSLAASLITYRAIRREPSKTSFDKKYGAGISWDATDDCRKAAEKLHKQGGTVTMILGEVDRIFPPHEIRQTLEHYHIKHVGIIILPKTPHASLATKQGRAILRQARAALGTAHAAIKTNHATSSPLR